MRPYKVFEYSINDLESYLIDVQGYSKEDCEEYTTEDMVKIITDSDWLDELNNYHEDYPVEGRI